MEAYGQATELIFRMFFFSLIVVLGVLGTALLMGLIVLGFIKAGKYLLVHISEAVQEDKKKILSRKIFALPAGNVSRMK